MPEGPAIPSGWTRWLIAITVMLSTFMEVLDTTVVNVSLPHIAGSLSATVDESTWTLTSYLVSNAIILPLTGWLSNYFGRKRMLLISVIGFTVGSFFCGLAPTLSFLVLFRVIQGACGGGLQPISQAILLETFPPEERGKAMGFWGLGIVVAPMLGPVLGGWLTDSFSWRWVFYINVPIGILAVIMTNIFVFDPHYIRRRSSRVDYWGIGMLALGIAALQIVLDKGQEKDWFSTRWMTLLALSSVITLVAFIVYELHTRDPVVDLRVFKNITYSTSRYGRDRRGDELPEELQRRETRMARIREAKYALEERAREQAQSQGKDPEEAAPTKKAQYSFTDPESRMLKGADGFLQGYNTQIAVEPVFQLIVGQRVTQEANDKQQMVPLVEAIEEQSGQKPEGVLADNGYCSDENLKYLARKRMEGFVATGKQKHSQRREPCQRGLLPREASRIERMERKLETKSGAAVMRNAQIVPLNIFATQAFFAGKGRIKYP